MLNSIRTTLNNATSNICNKAKETVSKIGEFHNRVVAPTVNSAKEQLTSLKSQLSSKYSQLWPRLPKNESKTEDKNWNCTVTSVGTAVEDLRSQFENKTLSTQELYDKLTGLASRARDANQLGSVLNLLDDVLKSDAPGTGLQHLSSLEQLQTAIKDSPLKGDSTTLNHVKYYFKSQTSQTKGFSVLDPLIQDALANGLAQKGANPPA